MESWVPGSHMMRYEDLQSEAREKGRKGVGVEIGIQELL